MVPISDMRLQARPLAEVVLSARHCRTLQPVAGWGAGFGWLSFTMGPKGLAGARKRGPPFRMEGFLPWLETAGLKAFKRSSTPSTAQDFFTHGTNGKTKDQDKRQAEGEKKWRNPQPGVGRPAWRLS